MCNHAEQPCLAWSTYDSFLVQLGFIILQTTMALVTIALDAIHRVLQYTTKLVSTIGAI